MRDEFPELLKRWRAEHGLTQVEASRRLRVNLRTLQDWEYGRHAPQGLARAVLVKQLTKGRK